MDGHTDINTWFTRDNAVAALEFGLSTFMWVGMTVVGLALAVGF